MERFTYLSKENTKCMKGIFAVFILLHHLYQSCGYFHGTYFGAVFQAMGYLSVGMFFFFTGYGLMFSSSKKDYMNSFLLKRFVPLYLFYLLLVFLYSTYRLMLGESLSFSVLLQSLVFGETYVPLGWYLQATFVIYLIWWAACKLAKGKDKRLVITGTCLVVYCLLCGFLGLTSTWYESVFCVPLGMLFALKKDTIDDILNDKAWMIAAVSGVTFVISCLASYLLPRGLIFKIISSVLFAVCVIALAFVFQKTKIINNRVCQLLGRYSLEIYASQGFMLLLRRGHSLHIDNVFIYLCAVLAGTAVISVFMKQLHRMVMKITIRNDVD